MAALLSPLSRALQAHIWAGARATLPTSLQKHAFGIYASMTPTSGADWVGGLQIFVPPSALPGVSPASP